MTALFVQIPEHLAQLAVGDVTKLKLLERCLALLYGE